MFASLVGTLELLPDDVREPVVGAVITKFRGDQSLLEPGVDAFEDRTGVPVLGVLPTTTPGVPRRTASRCRQSASGCRRRRRRRPDAESVTVAVPRLPRISNLTDLQPLAHEPGVRVAYIPPDAALDDADAVVLPGSKNTVDDLRALTDAGFGDRLRSFDGPVVGLCGGYRCSAKRSRTPQ